MCVIYVTRVNCVIIWTQSFKEGLLSLSGPELFWAMPPSLQSTRVYSGHCLSHHNIPKSSGFLTTYLTRAVIFIQKHKASQTE